MGRRGGLVIGRHRAILLQHAVSLRHAEVVWDAAELALRLMFFHGDVFEQNCVTRHVHVQ